MHFVRKFILFPTTWYFVTGTGSCLWI